MTKRWRRSARGSRRTSAANTAQIRPVQAGFGVGAAQHGDLMPQHEQLNILGGGRATQQQEQPDHLLEDQYTSRSDTAEIMPSRWRSSIAAGQRQVQHSGTPQATWWKARLRIASFTVRPLAMFGGSIERSAEELVVTQWTHKTMDAAVKQLDDARATVSNPDVDVIVGTGNE